MSKITSEAPSIIVIGHASQDDLFRLDALPSGSGKVLANDFATGGGGRGANAAVAASRLGARTALWSVIGADETGQEVLRDLDREGVAITAVRQIHGSSTSRAAVLVDNAGERLVIGAHDDSLPMEASWLPYDAIAGAAVVVSDMTWLEATERAFKAARRHRVPTLVDIDVGGGHRCCDVLALADYAILSKPALSALSGRDNDTTDHERDLARLLDLGITHAGVTLGEAGYAYLRRGESLRACLPFRTTVVDTTGAGDAFHGGFAWALANGLDDDACAKIASAVAALSCRALGARKSLPDGNEVDTVLCEQGEGGLLARLASSRRC